MKLSKGIFLTFLAVICYTLQAFATWSIIIIDSKTKEIGIAGASCTYSVYGIGTIVPGKGAVVVQAMSNNNARKKGATMVQQGIAPKKILSALRDPVFDPENQQYAIVCLYDLSTPVSYTGTSASPFKGSLTANGVSVQGNILADPGELKAILDAVLKGQKEHLDIAEILMRALEAGAELGGDKRCGERKAASAFISVAKPSDDPQNLSINLVVTGENENINAITALRNKFETWKADVKKK